MKNERKIQIGEKEYRNMKNAIRRQMKAKLLVAELWRLFGQSKVDSPKK